MESDFFPLLLSYYELWYLISLYGPALAVGIENPLLGCTMREINSSFIDSEKQLMAEGIILNLNNSKVEISKEMDNLLHSIVQPNLIILQSIQNISGDHNKINAYYTQDEVYTLSGDFGNGYIIEKHQPNIQLISSEFEKKNHLKIKYFLPSKEFNKIRSLDYDQFCKIIGKQPSEGLEIAFIDLKFSQYIYFISIIKIHKGDRSVDNKWIGVLIGNNSNYIINKGKDEKSDFLFIETSSIKRINNMITSYQLIK